jgi:chromate transporter
MENNEHIEEENNHSILIKPSIFQLIKFFIQVGSTSFGGGISMYLCEHLLRKKWFNEQKCLEALNLCQTLPGGTSVNLSTFIGQCFHGFLGALISPIVFLFPGAMLLLIASNILVALPHQHIIKGALSATAAATIGLILGMAIKLASSINQKPTSLVITLITFVLIGIYRLPVPFLIVGTGLIIFTWNKRQEGKVNASIN